MEEEIEVMVGEPEQISRIEQYVMEELRCQRVYNTLDSSPPVVASTSHIGVDEVRPNSIGGTEVGAWLMPLLSVIVRVCANIKWFPFGGEKIIKCNDWPLELNLHLTSVRTQKVRAFIRLYRRCFTYSHQDLEGYKEKTIHIQLEDDNPFFWRPYVPERIGAKLVAKSSWHQGLSNSPTGNMLELWVCHQRRTSLAIG